jgi:transmembrane sensor
MLIQRNSLGPKLRLVPGADAWTRGMLVVDNAPLEDVIAELGRYRQGYLGVASDVADLRITGSFPLNDIDLALNALTPTLPVAIEQRTPWWVTVVASAAPTAKKP